MAKSKAEIERLTLNAQAQHVLMQSHIRQQKDKPSESIKGNHEVYEPAGEIDYSKFNRAKAK